MAGSSQSLDRQVAAIVRVLQRQRERALTARRSPGVAVRPRAGQVSPIVAVTPGSKIKR